MAAASQPVGGAKDPKGLYSTLGASFDADVGDIRKAYRRLALRWHPDKNPDNPEATAEFQKISAAYEVLSDAERRALYDSRGCVDAEDLDGDEDLSHATDLFAAFFCGGFAEELDADEQSMFDEFLRLAGSAAFRRRPRRGKKVRGARARGSRQTEEDVMGQVFMSAMADFLGGAPASPACPKGHALKRSKSDGGYECDACGRDIAEGKRIFDCRKCDFSLCQKCHKAAEEAVEKEGEEDFDQEEIVEAFCSMNVHPLRQGCTLQFRCEICRAALPSQEEAVNHIKAEHGDEVQVVVDEVRRDAAGGGPFGGAASAPGGMHGMPPGGLEALFMGAAMEEMFGSGGMGPGPIPKGPRRSRKKR